MSSLEKGFLTFGSVTHPFAPHRSCYLAKKQLCINSCQGAVFAMLACINMYRLIPALLSLAAPLDKRMPLFKSIERENETVIVHLTKTVVKTIYDANKFFHKFGTSFKPVSVSVTLKDTTDRYCPFLPSFIPA